MPENETRRLPARSSRQLVAGLFAATVVVALGVALINFKLDYDETRSNLEQRARAYAVSMATDVRWYIDVARQTLRRTADSLANRPQSSETRVLRPDLSDLPDGVTVVVYDAAGSSRTLGTTGSTVNIADRPYFQQLRDGRSWVVSNLIADRVTGTKTFAIGLRLSRGGRFDGAAVAYAPMQVFSEAWLSVGGASANAFLVHDEGWITARLPPVDSIVYDEPVSMEFVHSFGDGNGSYWASASPIDGVARVLGFARVPSAPLVAVIGLSAKEELASFWDRVKVTLLILVPILGLLALAAWRIRGLMQEQERTADELAASLARNEELLLEIHHRVKNNLQSVLSLVRMQVKDPESITAVEQRIGAMVAVHEHIYSNVDFVGVRAPDYLLDIAQKVISSCSHPLQLRHDIADIELPSRIVMPLGQLINEAIINAAKYGYPDGRLGTITIRLQPTGDGTTTLSIHNDGVPSTNAAAGSGLGTRLMRAFAAQIGGTLETVSNEGGVTVKVTMPLDAARDVSYRQGASSGPSPTAG